MSRYARHTLQAGEKIVRVARLHWVIYAKAMAYVSMAFGIVILSYATIGLGRVAITLASGLAAMAVRHAIQAWWRQLTTEIAVTDKRVIYKTGFVQRHTNEMFLTRVESVLVDQSVLGRLLNFGSIHCRGTGVGLEHLHDIADPLAIQNAINSA
jgi:uncharacterized membrane protein YdbT with pleckstrin-like domain